MVIRYGIIQSVQLKIDNGDWMNSNGTSNWIYKMDTLDYSKGVHSIYVRSYDGEDYSNIESIEIIIENNQTPGFTTAVVISASIIGALVAFFRRRN